MSPEVAVSEELFAPVTPDVTLCYQTFGDPDPAQGDPLLLVMGLGGPMTWWDEDFCRMLAGRGFRVVRYDNRDTGRSTKIPARVRRSQLVRGFTTRRARAPYTLSDLAGDAVALLDHLGLPAAHVVGVSMGGMIAQTMAIEHRDRVLSLTSIMSTTGRRTVGWQSPKLLPMMVVPRGASRETYVRSSIALWKLIGSPDHPMTVADTRARAEETWDRGVDFQGSMRQMLAIVTQPDRTRALRGLTVPTTVIHGLSDVMVHPSGGRATAAAIPGAELLLVPGMGHDLPEPLFGAFVDAIRRTADRAAR